MQFQADILQTAVHRPTIQETTALGAAYLAGLGVGVWQSEAEIAEKWILDQEFKPQLPKEQSDALLTDWHRAVKRSQGWQE